MNLRLALAAFACVALAACAATDGIRDAENAVRAGRYEEGLAALAALESAGADAKQVQAALLRSRAVAVERMEREARAALEAERNDDAEAVYRRMAAVANGNAAARAGLEAVRVQRQREEKLARVEALLKQGDVDGAERRLREVMIEAPKHRRALKLMSQVAERQRKALPLAPVLGPEFRKTISLEFRDVGLKSVFDAIWNAAGVNFILDRDVRSDAKASIFVRDVSVEEAIDALLMGQQLARKTVGAKTLFVYPKTPQKTAEYQDLTVRNFYLAHAEAKQVQSMLKTILKTKDVFIDERRNLVVVRDSQDAVDMAEKLIRAHDQAEPEVMLALDVIEIQRSKLSEIGINFPNQVTFGVGNPITLEALNNLSAKGVNVGFGGLAAGTTSGPGVVGEVRFQKSDGDTNTLANPRIRVRNREKAKIHIGDRLPVVTTTSSTTSAFVGQTVNYLDVGLKLEVEPQVMLDDDVVIKLNLEVSSASQSKVNTSFYDVGTRTTSTVLTIRDGETQVLAGLIRDDERQSANRLPGFGDLPLIGRLFSNEHKEQGQTEIILAITPRVLRNLVRPEAALAEYGVGPESGSRGGAAAAPPGLVPRPVPLPLPAATAPASPVGGLAAPAAQATSPALSAPAASSNGLSFGVGAGQSAASPAAPSAPAGAPTPTGGVITGVDFETPPGAGR
ncbi:MAG: type II secretion system protein GspD [Rhodocyclales bacterium]|nr:type II secretion system protein GspD [Rhodocyclales bacterium]